MHALGFVISNYFYYIALYFTAPILQYALETFTRRKENGSLSLEPKFAHGCLLSGPWLSQVVLDTIHFPTSPPNASDI